MLTILLFKLSRATLTLPLSAGVRQSVLVGIRTPGSGSFAMVCSNCGESGHKISSCTRLKPGDPGRRGPRASPRTPTNEEAKLEKLRAMSAKMSPKVDAVPPLPCGEASSVNYAAASSNPQSSDEKLDKIMEMMGKVAVKDDIEAMKASLTKDFEVKTKEAISEAVDPLKSELHELKERIVAVEVSGCSVGGEGGWQKAIEKDMDQLRGQLKKGR